MARDASAGAINIITRAPTRDLSGYFDVNVGNFGRLDVHGAASGGLGEIASGRVAFMYESRDGLYRNLTTGQSANDVDMRGVRGTLRFEPSDVLMVDLVADWSRARQNGVLKSIIADVPGTLYEFFTRNPVTGRPRPGVTLPGQEADIRSARSGINGFQGLETRGLVLNGRYSAGSFDVVSITSWRDEGQLRPGGQRPRARDHLIRGFHAVHLVRRTGAALHLQRCRRCACFLDGGPLFLPSGRRPLDGDLPQRCPFSGITTFEQHLDTDSYAAFGEAGIRLADRWKFTGGLRYTRETKDFALNAYATRIPGIAATGPITPFLSAAISPPQPRIPGASFRPRACWSSRFRTMS
jgi:iron complex outermembrane receptor protein